MLNSSEKKSSRTFGGMCNRTPPVQFSIRDQKKNTRTIILLMLRQERQGIKNVDIMVKMRRNIMYWIFTGHLMVCDYDIGATVSRVYFQIL